MSERLTVVVTAAGCPGGPSVVRALQEGFRVVATDRDPEASGRFFADAFHVVPGGNEPGFVEALLDVCAREGAAALVPESSGEVLAVGERRADFEAQGVKALVSEPGAVAVALDKARTYQALEGAGVPLPRWKLVGSEYPPRSDDLYRIMEAAHGLGFPREPVVLKRPTGKGGRGFWIVEPWGYSGPRIGQDLRTWPNAQRVRMDEVAAWANYRLSRDQGLGRWLVMEYLENDPARPDTADLYGTAFGYTKIRGDCRNGVHFRHEARFDPELLGMARRAVERLGLEHFVNVQFMGGKLLEVNPRISTQILAPGYNMPLAGVQLALGLVDQVTATLPDGTRAGYYLDLRSYTPAGPVAGGCGGCGCGGGAACDRRHCAPGPGGAGA